MYENISRKIASQSYISELTRLWFLKIDFLSPCGLYMQFLFSKGKHLQSIDELLFVDPIVTESMQWQRPH